MRRLLLVLGLLLAAFVAPSAQAAGACSGTPAPAHYKHVVWVIFENRSFTQVKGHAPYLDSLASQCAYATKYSATDHPSQPNYIEMTSGKSASQVPQTDCPTFCPVKGASIFGQNPSWGVFAESEPSNCRKTDARPYVVHHTAAPYFVDLTNCATNDKPLTALNPAALPAFSLIIPNVVNDMHQGSSSVTAGNAWLSAHLPPVLGSADYLAGNTAVFVTFDEGGIGCGCNQIVLTLVLAQAVRPGTASATAFTHYSLLRTTEELLGYPLLGLASSATSMRSLLP